MRPALGGYHRKLCSQPAPVSDAPALLLGGAEASSFRRGDQAQPDILEGGTAGRIRKGRLPKCRALPMPQSFGARPVPSGTATLLRTSRITHSGETLARHAIPPFDCRNSMQKLPLEAHHA